MTASTCTIRAARNRRSGYSLAELLISIGIFGMGMAMVTALFPAAISESADSYANQVGMNIAESGLAVAQGALLSRPLTEAQPNMIVMADEWNDSSTGDHHFSLPWDFDNQNKLNWYYLVPYLDEDNTDWALANNQEVFVNFYYPSQRNMGFALLGRQTEAGDYQFVSVAWRRLSRYVPGVDQYGGERYGNTNRIMFKKIDCSVDPGSTEVRISTDMTGAGIIGSPLVVSLPHSDAALFATIESFDRSTNTAKLDRPLGNGSAVTEAFVLIEENQPNLSPALATMSVRTGLRYRK